MMLAAHQPAYLPAIDFFYKMALADVFILADDVRYSTHPAINRAKIKTAQGATWLTVPVLTKGRSGQRVNQVEVDNQQNWRSKHWKSLQTNYTFAAYFDLHADFFEKLYLYEHSPSKLVESTLPIIYHLVSVLNLKTKVKLSSDFNLRASGQEWIFQLAEATGCDTYLADISFSKYLSTEMFFERGVLLSFISPPNIHYYQQFEGFLPGLSIVDLVFNEGERCHEILQGNM